MTNSKSKRSYRKLSDVNEAKATCGAFGKPRWQRTEEELKRNKKITQFRKEEKSLLEKVQNFLGINRR